MKKHIHFIAASALMLMSVAGSFAQRITVTVAGSGTNSYSGDNGPAKQAAMSRPNDVCIDAAHNIYFTDQSQTVVRKVSSATGVITTIAGGGSSAADGIPAIAASIAPVSLCVDPSGNVYIASGSLLRKVNATTGMINTVAGAGTSLADGVPAASASLAGLNSICSDMAGNIYVIAGNRVRKINASTGMIYTVAGTGTGGYTGDGGPAITATLSAPKYITSDHLGNIYFGDQNAGLSFAEVVRRIDAVTGTITSVIGGPTTGLLFDCTGMSCMIGGLSGICCDANDDVIFNEWSCSCRKWNHTTNWVTSIAGNFYTESFKNDTTSEFAFMNNNFGICADEANNYYIADRENHRIRKVMTLTSAPSFAFGEAQTVRACAAGTISIDQLLWIVDQDASQTETWTVVTPPSLGALSGFPATASSHGPTTTTKPSGLHYTSYTASATDSFVISVSDGTSSDLIKIIVNIGTPVAVYGSDNVCIGSAVSMEPTVSGGTWSTSNPNASVSPAGVVTGVTEGTDNIIYTVDNGCGIVTILHPVIVSLTPNAGIITGYGGVCEEATTALSNTAIGGVWSVTGTNATVSATGVVTGIHAGPEVIVYNVTNACGTATASKTVNVFALPNPGIISGSDEVCVQASTTLTTSTLETGYWTVSNSNATVDAATGLVHGMHPGTVVVAYKVTNECGMREASKSVNVKNCAVTDIPEIAQQSAIVVYPNPASSTLTIKGDGTATGHATISMTDVAGRVVLQDGMNASATKELNVGSLASGVYLLSVTGDGVHFVDKVVIGK